MPRKKAKDGGAPPPPSANGQAPPTPPPQADPRAGMPIGAVPSGRYLPLLYPGQHGLLRVVLVGDWAFGWCSHWLEQRTSPHHSDSKECPGCKQGQLPVWAAYVLGLACPSRRLGIVKISGEAWINCPDLSSMQGNLRGITLTLRRTGTGVNGRVAALVERTAPVEGLPADRDVRPLLSLYWGMNPDWLEWQCGPYRTGINPPAGKGGDK